MQQPVRQALHQDKQPESMLRFSGSCIASALLSCENQCLGLAGNCHGNTLL